MTSQLILANGSGVAIASDSAATLRRPHDSPRTYEDAEKIRALGKPHRLAVLNSGRTQLVGLPALVLAGAWEEELGSTRLETVEQYRDSFLDWLESHLDDWSSSDGRDNQLFWPLDETLGDLRQSVNQAIENLPDEEREEATLQIVQEKIQERREVEVWDPILEGMAEGILDRLEQRADGRNWILGRILVRNFGDLPFSEQLSQALRTFLEVSFGRSFSAKRSIHLAFVGYGQTELWPAVSCVYLEGAIGNHVARNGLRTETLSEDVPSLIEPIAQTSMIDLIIGRHNPELLHKAGEVAREAFEKRRRRVAELFDRHRPQPGGSKISEHDEVWAKRVVEAWEAAGCPTDEPLVLDGEMVDLETIDFCQDLPKWIRDYTRKLDAEVSREVMDLLQQDLETAAQRVSDQDNWWPIFRNLAHLEVPSLAHIAETLVSTQNLVQDLRGELPTVGGPIDVATITRSEGFEWVKHRGAGQASPG